MATSGDPVGAGLVASLARRVAMSRVVPLNDAVVPKQLELLKEAVPKISSRLMASPAILPEMMRFKELQSMGPSLNVTVELVEIRGPESFESAFAARFRPSPCGYGPSESSYIPYRQQIVTLAAKHQLAGGIWI